MTELFAPKNLLETCIGVEEVILSNPPELQDKIGMDFEEMLGQKVDYFGANKLEINSQQAFGLPDRLTTESNLWPLVEYGQVRVRAYLSGVQYWRIGSKPPILAWMTVEPKIHKLWGELDALISMDPEQEYAVADIIKEESSIRRPLYFPVRMIKSVLIAA